MKKKEVIMRINNEGMKEWLMKKEKIKKNNNKLIK